MSLSIIARNWWQVSRRQNRSKTEQGDMISAHVSSVNRWAAESDAVAGAAGGELKAGPPASGGGVDFVRGIFAGGGRMSLMFEEDCGKATACDTQSCRIIYGAASALA